jgi:hypothetical protein
VRHDELGTLADMTGGRLITQSETPETQIPALFAESQSYYLLAFAPGDSKADGKFHNISVKVNRDHVKVQTRSGYYAGGKRGEKPASTLAPETVNAIEGVLPQNDFPLSVAAAPFALPGAAQAAVAVVLSVRQPQPAKSDAKNPVKVLVAAFDRNGRSVQSETKTLAITWKADASGYMSYELLSKLTLKPGRYELRAAVDAAVNQRGSVYTYVDVPDFVLQPLSLSGIAIGTTPGLLSTPQEIFASLLPIVPTARRSFTPSEQATAFVRIYEASKQAPVEATVTTRLVDENDKVISNDAATIAAARFATARAVDHRVELPLGTLASGDYLLTVEAKAGEYRAGRHLRFTVK